MLTPNFVFVVSHFGSSICVTVASILHLIYTLAFIMPTASRIDWVSRQIAPGRKVHVAVGAAKDTSKCKVKIILQNADAGAMEQGAASCALGALARSIVGPALQLHG